MSTPKQPNFAGRSGRYILQPTGYRAFIPSPLPPSDPPIQFDDELIRLQNRALLTLGRLDGASDRLVNPDLFIAMYVRQEAVLSSEIEGTQSTLQDVLAREAGVATTMPEDVDQVVNYVRALNYGLERLQELPLSLRLIREIHEILLEDVRGADRQPGELRRSQNWIGGSAPSNAAFVPPPPHEMMTALDNFERFLHDTESLPELIQIGVAHAQFETIHPFLDGNGRVGRLLIAFLLVERNLLHRPLLYISHYFKGHRQEYYDRLQAVRDRGDWEGWIKFFLRAVGHTAEQAYDLAHAIDALREEHRQLVAERGLDRNGSRLLDILFRSPYTTVSIVQERLGLSFSTANRILAEFEKIGLIEQATEGRRNRVFRYAPYIALFTDQ